MTPYCFSTFSRRSWKQVTRRLCKGFSCSVVLSSWTRIPSARRGIWKGGEEYLSVLEGCCHGYRGNDKQRIYLQGDEAFKFLNALTVLWVRLDVGVCEESLQRMEPEWKLDNLGSFCVVKALSLKIQLLATLNRAPKSGKEATVVYLWIQSSSS